MTGIATVEDALLARARREAAATVAAAEEWRRTTLDAARRQAAGIAAAARAEGEADAADALRGARSRIRREARARVLGARREAYDQLCEAATDRVAALLDEHAGTREALLRGEATARLGPGAWLREDDGEPVAEVPGRRLRVEPAELVARALAALGPDVAGLWSP